MTSELHFVTYIRIFFGHCLVTFPYMLPLSFFGRFVQNVIVSWFSDSFDKRTTKQLDDSGSVTNDNQILYKINQKMPFLYLQTQMENNLWGRNTVLLATMTRCASYPIADITLF